MLFQSTWEYDDKSNTGVSVLSAVLFQTTAGQVDLDVSHLSP